MDLLHFLIKTKEADAKRTRANFLAEDERQLQIAKDLEITRLREEFKNSIKIKEEMKDKISKYSAYNDFMKEVSQQKADVLRGQKYLVMACKGCFLTLNDFVC